MSFEPYSEVIGPGTIRRVTKLLIGFLVVFAIKLLVFGMGSDLMIVTGIVGLSALAWIISAWTGLPRLVLTEEGFAQISWWGLITQRKWVDILGEFVVKEFGFKYWPRRSIGYNFATAEQERQEKKLPPQVFGFDAYLGDEYELPVDELAALLNLRLGQRVSKPASINK